MLSKSANQVYSGHRLCSGYKWNFCAYTTPVVYIIVTEKFDQGPLLGWLLPKIQLMCDLRINRNTDLVCGNRRIAIAILQITRKTVGSEAPVEYQVPNNKNQHMMDGETIYKVEESNRHALDKKWKDFWPVNSIGNKSVRLMMCNIMGKVSGCMDHGGRTQYLTNQHHQNPCKRIVSILNL